MQHSDLILQLQDPEIFDDPVERFSVLETHISWVLLAGDFAYKIKKPVNLGFLDFSTLEKRRHFCFEELRLNSRLAPDIYIEVVNITGNHDSPRINGTGRVIEYAVKMRRFEQQNLLVNLIQSGNFSPEYIDQLAAGICGFHDTARIAELTSPFGTLESVLRPVKENFRQIRQFIGADYSNRLDPLEKWSLQEHHRRRAVFEKRKKDGKIKECHGDLHLGNIVLYRNRITPFDGIEFNQSLNWIDVISEMAFLFMDLEYHKRTDLAFRALNAWLERTGDYGGLKVLRYYLVYRALVRAKVNCIRIRQDSENEEFAISRNEFLKYLHQAETYIRPAKPRLIICHGLSASGKSTVSQLLLEILPGIRIRSDVERKRLFNLKSDQNSHSEINNGLYTDEISKLTYQRLAELASIIIESGYSVIVDGTFLLLEQRKQFRSLAGQYHIPFLIVHCESSKTMMIKRIMEREKFGTDPSEAGLEVLEHQMQSYRKLLPGELADCIKINTENKIDVTPILKWHLNQ